MDFPSTTRNNTKTRITAPQESEDKNNFLDKLYQLSSGRIHNSERQKVVRTHLKHIEGNFVNFTKDEYQKFIVNWYVTRLLNKKTFSVAYMQAVIDSINRFKQFSRSPISKREVYMVVKNMKKIFNSESTQSLFYTKQFDAVHLDLSKIENLRQNNVMNKFSDKLYENANFEILLQYNKEQLDNFLKIGVRPRIPSVQDDLALIVIFLASSPRRIREILQLTIKKIKELILNGQTQIKTKNGEGIFQMLIPQQLSKILNEYLHAVGYGEPSQKIDKEQIVTLDDVKNLVIFKLPNLNENNDNDLLFKRSYYVYYSAIKSQYKSLFNDNIGRPFHAFRNYFSAKYIKKDPDATKRALGHCNMKMTRSYANKQLSKFSIQNTSEFLTQNYPFAAK